MNTLKFQTQINAPKDRVWNALWDPANYREWTRAFSDSSHFDGELKQGKEIDFLDGDNNGMYARVETLKPNEEMAFRHVGEIRAGQRQDPSTEWGNNLESYSLSEVNGRTTLDVSVDAPDEYAAQMNDMFPKALANLKALAEKQH